MWWRNGRIILYAHVLRKAPRHVQHLEQRLHAVETQHLAEVQKRLSVLEEVFVLEGVALQRKLRQAVGSDGLTPPSPPTGKSLEHP
jgi:hypothetical protein